MDDLAYWIRVISGIVCVISLGVALYASLKSNKNKALDLEHKSQKLKDAVNILAQWKNR